MPYILFQNNIRIYFLYFTLFISGAVILVIEIAGVRVLAPFYGSTIFVWSSLITTTLGFLAFGYIIGGVIADKHPKGSWFYFIIFLGGALELFLIKISQPILVFSEHFAYRWGSLVGALILFALPLFLLSMAGPFAIRLRTRLLEHTGHVSGNVFATSTFGSLVGALLVGYYLIPNFFISDIFTIATLVLMIIGIIGLYLEKSSRWIVAASLVLLVLILSMPFTFQSKKHYTIIHREPSFYGEIEITENEDFRCLLVDSFIQSCVYKINGEQPFLYVELIITLLNANELRNKDALFIGLGGGVFTRDLVGYFNTIDVVEIDPKIVKVAKEFFGYDDMDPRINTYIEDGRSYIQKSRKKYDVIIIDAFSGATLVPHLFTKEVFEMTKNILLQKGLLLVNSIGRPYGNGEVLPQSVFKTLSSVFPYCRAISTENIKSDPEAFGNIIFIASMSKKKLPIREKFIIPYTKENTFDGKLLTDIYNPIEVLSIPFIEKAQKIDKEFLND